MRGILVTMGLLAASVCQAQVRADAFETGMVSGVDFNTLTALADKWEMEAQYTVFHDGMTDRELFGAHGEVKALEKCARELKDLVQSKSTTKAEDMLVYQQENPEAFGQAPPKVVKPQPFPSVPDYGPGGPSVDSKQAPNHNQAPMKNVQAPIYACAPAAATYSTYSSGGGGRWRLFGRRAGGGGFRIFRRGGC